MKTDEKTIIFGGKASNDAFIFVLPVNFYSALISAIKNGQRRTPNIVSELSQKLPAIAK